MSKRILKQKDKRELISVLSKLSNEELKLFLQYLDEYELDMASIF